MAGCRPNLWPNNYQGREQLLNNCLARRT
jgi:hypothetical protein